MSYTEFTCRSGGSNLYAGSLDGSAEASVTPLVTYTNGGWNSGTGVFTPASGNPVSAGVVAGQWVSVYTDGASAPTGFVGRVTAVSTTTITVSITAKSGTIPTTGASGLTAVVGGAWLGPTGASGFPFSLVQGTMVDAAGDTIRVNFKNDQTYNVTAAVTFSGTGPFQFQGYGSSFGDGGKSILDGGTTGASYTPLTISGSRGWTTDIEFRNNGATGSADLVVSNGGRNGFLRCVFHDCRGSGLNLSGNLTAVVECEAYTCNASNTTGKGGFLSSTTSTPLYSRCIAHDNTGSNNVGFFSDTYASFVECIADTNGSLGFSMGAGLLTRCIAYNNGSHGVYLLGNGGGSIGYMDGCILVSNGGYGVSVSVGGGNQSILLNNAFYSNTSGQVNGTVNVSSSGVVTLSGDPFLDAPNRDFDINNTAGAGASLRAVTQNIPG